MIMASPLSITTLRRQQICGHCGLAHKLLTLAAPSYNLIPHRNNWRKNLAKREAKKKVIHEYVGSNAVPTSVVYAWGAVPSGALGIPSYVQPSLKFDTRQISLSKMNRPARVRSFDKQRMKPLDIACGYGFSVMTVKKENKKFLMGTGINTDSQIGYHEAPRGSGRILDQLIEPARINLPLAKRDDCKVKSMACGRAHTVVIVEDEGVFTLGNNAYGQCGRSIVEGEDYSKNQMINKLKDLPENIIKVVCGQDHTMFLTESGEVYSCGLGADGQTGQGHYKSTAHPERVKGDIEGEKIVSIGSRGDCSMAVSDKGDLFGWGNSEYSQLGLVTEETQVNVPKHFPLSHVGKVVKAIAGGAVCALLNDQGQVFVWGYGILGKGPKLELSANPAQIPDPIFGRNELAPDAKVIDIECGLTYIAALNDKGDLFSWGRNNKGCLGLGEEKNQFFPWRIALPAQPVKFSCGLDHMLALCKSFT